MKGKGQQIFITPNISLVAKKKQQQQQQQQLQQKLFVKSTKIFYRNFIFLSAIWLLYGHLWAIIVRTAPIVLDFQPDHKWVPW